MRLLAALSLSVVLSGCVSTMATTTNSGAPGRTSLFARYDRVRGETTVQDLIVMRTSGFSATDVSLEADVVHPDSVLREPPERAWLIFRSSSGTSGGWRFLRDHDLALLIDGQQRMQFDGDHDGDAGGILLHEVVSVPVPLAVIDSIAAASTVEGSLGPWSFSLKPEEIAKFRELALFAHLDPNAPRPSRGRQE